MTLADLPFAVQRAGVIRLTVTFEGGRNFAVVSEVYREVPCQGWSDVLSVLREQRDALADTGLPVVATYFPNESALSASRVEF